jgi:hypothetical protein
MSQQQYTSKGRNNTISTSIVSLKNASQTFDQAAYSTAGGKKIKKYIHN